jgi:hypothetical protein
VPYASVPVHFLAVACLECHEEMTAVGEHSLELGEHLAQMLRRGVDDRIPTDGA